MEKKRVKLRLREDGKRMDQRKICQKKQTRRQIGQQTRKDGNKKSEKLSKTSRKIMDQEGNEEN